MTESGHCTDVTDCWQCAECGESGSNGVPRCPECGSMQLGTSDKVTDLPPCWKESDLAAAFGVDRVFVHLDGPGFIGVEDGTAELVRADLSKGEEPEPETKSASLENIQELAKTYNDEFYGEDNHALQPESDQCV